MNGWVVVDASLAAKWLVNEIHTEKAYALARSWAEKGIQPVAPYLMPVEVANVLYRRALQGDISLETATSLLDGLMDAGIEYRQPQGIHHKAIDLAAQLQQDTIYDAHYLALAESLDCEFWTADQRFYKAAKKLSHRVKWLGSVDESVQPDS
jgi:predicted nucleic acid-binding protein